MNVTKLVYTRLHNLGEYEHEKIELSIALNEGDTPSEALNRARVFIEKKLIPHNNDLPDGNAGKYEEEQVKEWEAQAALATDDSSKAYTMERANYYRREAQAKRELAERQLKRLDQIMADVPF